MENPYFHRTPVKDRRYFFGRRDETAKLFHALRDMQCYSIVGPRRIGKTSLLRHLQDPTMLGQGELDGEYVLIFLDCAAWSQLDQVGWYQVFGEEVKAQTADRADHLLGDPGDLTSPRAFDRLIRKVTNWGFKLVFLLDEFEAMATNPQLDAPFFSHLRQLAFESVAFVTASRSGLYDLTRSRQSVLNSPFFNIFYTLNLGLFKPEEALDLIDGPSRAAGLVFSPATRDFILHVAGRHPFLLQVACYYVFEYQARLGSLGQHDLDSAMIEICEGLSDQFASWWDSLDPHQRELLLLRPTSQSEALADGTLAALERKCLIAKHGHRYDYVGAIVERFVKEQAKGGTTGSPLYSLVGRRLGPYRVAALIGSGSVSRVYRAYQASLDRHVAIKVLSDNPLFEEGVRQRFEQEARAIARLEHQNILPIYEFVCEGALTYIVMQYIPDGTLKDRMDGPLDWASTLPIITQVCEALMCAHRHGILHRDIKPSNILVTADGWVLLTDFGLARFVSASLRITHIEASLLGTPDYMAPEQIRGGDSDVRTDVYALGILLYEMLTGHLPFECEAPADVLVKKLKEEPTPPSQFVPSLPSGVESLILKALARAPEERFQSVEEFLSMVEQVSF